MQFINGAGNDVVKVYLDGVLKHTGTSWEDYYRYDPEAAADPNTRPVDSIMFRVAGTAVPANSGRGFLVDNFSSYSGAASAADLTGLSLSSGTLSPAFNASTTAYTASVDNSVTDVTVTKATSPGANAVVSGGSNLPDGVGAVVTITVTAADGTTTKTYTVTVIRAVCAVLLSPAKRTTLPSGDLRLTQRLQFNGIDRHTFIFIDPRTGTRVSQLPDSAVGKRRLRRTFSAPVLVFSKPGTIVDLASVFDKNLPATVKRTMRLRIMMRNPDGTLSDVTP